MTGGAKPGMGLDAGFREISITTVVAAH
jgi:hypothetical protein